MFTRTALLLKNKFLSMNSRTGKSEKYVKILWGCIMSGILFGGLTILFYDEISKNNILAIAATILVLPAMMGYFSLLIDLAKHYKFKLLILVPLLYFPKVFFVAILLIPILYLAWVTYCLGMIKHDKHGSL